MLHTETYALPRQRLLIDFITLKHACPLGIYVAPVSENSLLWTGVVFVRKGPYAKAVLRFEVNFPEDYPARPPVVTFLSDIFHPLIAPLTTYTYTSRDRGVETVSAADEDKLPPGGLSLRHGFPEWYGAAQTHEEEKNQDPGLETQTQTQSEVGSERPRATPPLGPTNSVPLEAAANPGAWHAWKSYRTRSVRSNTASPSRSSLDVSNDLNRNRSMSPNKQQPGGARRPGEWNWTGVWEDRVKKAVQASISDTTLFAGDESKVIDFTQMDDETYNKLAPIVAARAFRPENEQPMNLRDATASADV